MISQAASASDKLWASLGNIGHHCVMFQDYAQIALFPASTVIADNTRKRLSWSLEWVSSHCLRSSIALWPLWLRQVAVTFLLIILISFESWNTVEFLPCLAQSIEPAAANVPPAIHLHWLHWQHGKHSPAGAMPPQESPARNDWLMASTTREYACLPLYKCWKTLETWNNQPEVRLCGFCAGIRARLLKQPSSKTSRLQQNDLPSPNLEFGPALPVALAVFDQELLLPGPQH